MDIFEKLKALSRPEPAGPMEFIIAGLGNPGPKYEGTRHNAGFMALDRLAKAHNIDIKKVKFHALCGDGSLNEKRCLLMKPTTFMNNSGEAVAEAARFYKIPPENIIVLFDDISLEPSQLRIRRRGSDGGHNGIKSILACLGEDSFPRIKIGVGKKPRPDYDLADWVLSAFRRSEYEALQEALDKAAAAVALMVTGKTDEAMNKFNS